MIPLSFSGVMGAGLILSLLVVVVILIAKLRLPGIVKLMIVAGLFLRLIGAGVRHAMAADAHVYFQWGVRYAEFFSRLDLQPLVDSALWRGATWYGTNFVAYPAGFLVALVGPNWHATFIGFTLIAFGGIAAFALAYRRAFPREPYTRYWAWLLLFPSLWFWPSSIGKEAIMMFGLGLATLGFAGRNRRPNIPLMALGLFFVFAIRPQVVAVFLLAVLLAYSLNFRNWTIARSLRTGGILAVGLGAIWFMMVHSEIGSVEVGEVVEYVDENASRNQYGGSSIQGVGASPTDVPLAVKNVLFRPFIWEAHNATALLAALELLVMWGLIFSGRHRLLMLARSWRQDRMLRFAVVFALVYIVALGMNLSNMGLLARQRVLVFPFLFLIFEAAWIHGPSRWLRRPIGGRPGGKWGGRNTLERDAFSGSPSAAPYRA